MTYTIVRENVGDIHISIEQDKYETAFKVEAVKVDDIGNGYPLKSGIYPTIDKATARYKALIRKAKKGELN